MPPRTHSFGKSPLRSLGLAALIAAASAPSLKAVAIYKDATSTDMTVASSWNTDNVSTTDPTTDWTNLASNTLYFTEVFAPTAGTGYTATMATNMSVGAIRLDRTSGSSNIGNVTISGAGTLTLNGNNDYNAGYLSGIVLNAGLGGATGGTLTISSNILLGATQTWVASRNLSVSAVNLGSSQSLSLNAAGSATITISGLISGAGSSISKVSGTGTVVISNTTNTFNCFLKHWCCYVFFWR